MSTEDTKNLTYLQLHSVTYHQDMVLKHTKAGMEVLEIHHYIA